MTIKGHQHAMPKSYLSLTAGLSLLVSFALSSGQAAATELRPEALDIELQGLLTLLPGRYAGPLASAEMPDREGMIYHTIEAIALPEHGEQVLLHVVSLKGFDDPQPFQQKFYALDTDPNRARNQMASIVVMRAARWQQGDGVPENIIRFPPECAISWRRDDSGFVARVKRGDCVYESAAFGGAIIPDMTYVVSPESFAIRDLLYRPDGSLLTPGGGFVTASRIAESDLTEP